MAANVPNTGLYLDEIATLFTTIRNRMQECQDQSGYIASMGGAAFLEAIPPNGLGMSAADANALIASLGNMTALATHYQGGPVAPALDYKSNTKPFWGGQ
jgi:hypothetical protein